MFKPYEELTEIEKVERALFILECKDHWNSEDWNAKAELMRKLRALEENEKKKNKN